MRAVALEKKRVERSGNCFVLMLLTSADLASRPGTAERAIDALDASTRATDVKGWFETGRTIGVLFTEIGWKAGRSAVGTLSGQVRKALAARLSAEEFEAVALTFHFYPEDWTAGRDGGTVEPVLYPEHSAELEAKRPHRLVKRAMDVAGSLTALAVLSPLMLAIAALVKATSKGPAIFRQKRVGQYGREFVFLKFRSMYSGCGEEIHQEYVASFIAGENPGKQDSPRAAYKLTNDPRITPLGRFLRRTSLDELPQFLNVLAGDMSLVGPRPPLPYEFRAYDLWHRRRLLSVKPGITGLWQVHGRSQVTFDEMVRLDLRYAENWSPWLDLKILLMTPKAVLTGTGAY